jgi:diguanylate cyclase
VQPGNLKIEITESTLMADPQRALEILKHLQGMGVGISIDDFGTGYSSLSYLKRLPVDEIKIDKSFVQHMAVDESDAAIVRSTIGLGHDLGLSVVAEGVENQETLALLTALGCDVAQGLHLGPPAPAPLLPASLDRPLACMRG